MFCNYVTFSVITKNKVQQTPQTQIPLLLNQKKHKSTRYPSCPLYFTGNLKKPVIYSAMFLEEKNNFLKTINIPEGWKRWAHHCTLEFKPKNGYPEGKGILQVLEIRKTPEVIVAIVSPPKWIKTWAIENQGKEPPWHVTIATAPGVKPVKAKKVAQLGLGTVVKKYKNKTINFIAGGFYGK